MALFRRDQFAKQDDDAGIFMTGLGAALITWTAMQQRKMTVHDAAVAFNTTHDVIVEACELVPWISVSDDGATLELDGA